jgi:hypothetical protein
MIRRGAHRLQKAPLLLVEWNDAASHRGAGGSWVTLDDVTPNPVPVRSIGWLLHDTPQALTLVSTHHAGDMADKGQRSSDAAPGSDDQASGVITIPKGWITKRLRLHVP